jgi:hypothetical protein
MPRTLLSKLWSGPSMSVIVALTGPTFIAEDDWAEYMRLVRARLAADPTLEHSRNLTLSDGGSPTARQRREVIEATHGTRAIASVISSSRLVRGVGTALSWFIPELKVFGPREYRRALRHLGIPYDREPSLWRSSRRATAR